MLSLAFAETIDDANDKRFNYHLTTGATTGTFITPYFQQTFELRNFRKQMEYILNILDTVVFVNLLWWQFVFCNANFMNFYADVYVLVSQIMQMPRFKTAAVG